MYDILDPGSLPVFIMCIIFSMHNAIKKIPITINSIKHFIYTVHEYLEVRTAHPIPVCLPYAARATIF